MDHDRRPSLVVVAGDTAGDDSEGMLYLTGLFGMSYNQPRAFPQQPGPSLVRNSLGPCDHCGQTVRYVERGRRLPSYT